MEKVNEDWRKLHFQELYGSDQSPNLIRMIKFRRLRKGGYDECTMEHFVLENMKERDLFQFININEGIILKWVINGKKGKAWIGMIGNGIETIDGLL